MKLDLNLGLVLPGVVGAVVKLFSLIDLLPGNDSYIEAPIVVLSKSCEAAV